MKNRKVKVTINWDRFFDVIISAWDSTAYYHRVCIDYKRKYGIYPYIGYGITLDDDIVRILYAKSCAERDEVAIDAMFDILSINNEKYDRAIAATRALRRWYDKTDWQLCPDEELLKRLGNFIMG